jgi:hypothetical protein
VGRVAILLLKLTHVEEKQAWMYILYFLEAVYIAHDISLEKKGLECTGSITRKDIRLFRGNPGAESGLCTFSLLFAQLVLHEMHLLNIDLHSDRYQVTQRGAVLFYFVHGCQL